MRIAFTNQDGAPGEIEVEPGTDWLDRADGSPVVSVRVDGRLAARMPAGEAEGIACPLQRALFDAAWAAREMAKGKRND